jgi:hypothetical protein
VKNVHSEQINEAPKKPRTGVLTISRSFAGGQQKAIGILFS